MILIIITLVISNVWKVGADTGRKIRRYNMTRKEFAKEISKKTGIIPKSAEELTKTFLETIMDTVASGESISFIGFGTFGSKVVSQHEGVDLKTGEKKMIADKLGTVYILYGVIEIDSTVITDNVQTSFSYTFIIIIKSLTTAAVCKHFTVSVVYRACIVKIACRCQMKITKNYHPILCIDKYIYCVIKKSRKKCYCQNKNDI